MDIFVTVIMSAATALVSILQLCMLLRALLPLFMMRDDHPVLLFCAMVTEPIVAPVRALFDYMGWFTDLPIDVSFFVAYLLLNVVSTVLALFA